MCQDTCVRQTPRDPVSTTAAQFRTTQAAREHRAQEHRREAILMEVLDAQTGILAFVEVAHRVLVYPDRSTEQVKAVA